MVANDRTAYGPAIAELLQEKRLLALGPGRPHRAVQAQLQSCTVEQAFAHARIRDREMAAACLAGLWLYHDFLAEAHEISQSIDTATGSYWHGFMHRREPDFANAKYWVRRVGNHPVFVPLRGAAAQLAVTPGRDESAAFLMTQPAWDPFAFVDLCEACVEGRSAGEMLCRQIQQREWELLFDYCYRQAVGERSDR